MALCSSCKYLDKTHSIAGPETGFYINHWCTYHGKYVNDGDSCSAHEEKEGCFLTAACVNYLGKPDDCHELTTLRTFRDGYLKKTAEGSALVEQYYEIAPKIVEKIEASGKQKEYYEYIYGVVTECVACIEKGDSDGALARYRDMTLTLKEKLL